MKLVRNKRIIQFVGLSFLVFNVQAATITVSSTADAGAGTLREAITTANGNGDASNTIDFSVSGALNLVSLLPTITKQLTIDGTGQNFIIDSNSNTTVGLEITAAAPNSIIQNITIRDIGLPPSTTGEDATGIIVDGAGSLIDTVTITDINGTENTTLEGDGGDAFGVNIGANNVTVQSCTISAITGGEGDSTNIDGRVGGQGGVAQGIALGTVTGGLITGNTISNTIGGEGGLAGGSTAPGGDGGQANGVFIASGGTNNTILNNNISDNAGGIGGNSGSSVGTSGPGGAGGLAASIRVGGDNNTISQNTNLTSNAGGLAGNGGPAGSFPGPGGTGGLAASIRVGGDNNTISQNTSIGGNVGGDGGNGGLNTSNVFPSGNGGNGGDGDGILLVGSGNTANKNTVLDTNTGGSGGSPGGGGSGPGTPGVAGTPFGVVVDTGTLNPILANSIFGNASHFGIRLVNNGNNNQVEPTLTSLRLCTPTSEIIVMGSLNTTDPTTTFTIQVFTNGVSMDPEQGRTFMGDFSVVTDGGGNVTFNETFISVAGAVNDFATATATRMSGATSTDTSEFSVPLQMVNNQAPTAIPQNLVTNINTPISGTLMGIDPESMPLTFAITSGPSNGIITGFNASTGAFTYTPNMGFIGNDSFMFTANDGCNTSAAATVQIFVFEPGSELRLGPNVLLEIYPAAVLQVLGGLEVNG